MRLVLGRYDGAVRQATDALTSARAAGRIFARDATFWGGDEARQRSVANRLAWLDVASMMRSRVDELQRFAEQVRADGFADAVLLGMGGSSLAPEVLRRSFGARDGWPRLHVLDTTDPATIAGVARAIDPARTLVFVSSKSGTTIEPNCLYEFFADVVRRSKGDAAGENFVAVTDPGTQLEQLARERGFRHVFTNPPDIGGRYSALSYFGLAPAAVMGIDLAQPLDRGIAGAEAAGSGGDALQLGAALGALALAGRNKVTFVVAPPIDSFGLWVEQLIAESTGKLGRGIVPVAGEQLGAPERYGGDRVFVQLRVNGATPPEHDAFIETATAAGHPAIVIDLADAFDLGREFFRWEFAVAVAGQVLGINPFDEPNVQESKDNTNRVLGEFESSGQLDVQGVDESPEPVVFDAPGRVAGQPLGQAVGGLLAQLRSGDYFAITAYVPSTESTDGAFEDMRAAVRDATGVATTLGYGPRFLHSTGQLHKGGPPQGVFLQVTMADEPDVVIPGRPYTFGQLKRAQAIGDFESLAKHGRPVLRVHLGPHLDDGMAELLGAVRASVQRRAELR
ncbi:MAG: glucose-6-phosphate isomerase [Dehalococcoidia bacterium]|nr:MAG: glucose-6-phosphate isomerase [Dehalococcoidia bacterium]